jgi:PAS domain S-box-containing protein
MNGSIHRERTASEPQDRSSSVAHSIEVPAEIIRKWQEFVNLLAEIMHVPSASIMRADPPHIKVFVSSTSKGNPCEPGALDTGPYCDTVMRTGQPLLVPDARENEAWKENPHVKLGMISYLGVPIGWPDGRLFGTICVRDNKRNEYSEVYLKLLLHFRDMLQADLKSFATLHSQLEQHEAKIRRLVDANIVGIFVWDFDGRVLEANDEFLRMVNYDREDLVAGRIRWADLTPPDWRDRNNARIEQQKSSGRFEPFEKEYTRKDGSRVPVLIGGATFEEGGNQGVAFVLDLTERKRAEQALMRSEAYLAEAQKLTHTGSWAWDPRTETVLYCSEEMFRIFGLDPRESLPSRDNFRQQIHPEDRDWVKKRFEESLRERVDSSAEYRVLLPDGTVRHINASGHVVLSEDGELIEFVGTAVDVTERKRAEETVHEVQMQLAHGNRVATMGHLSASITHEVNQPITAAVTYALAARRFLSVDPPNLHEVDDALSLVVKEGHRAGEVVERIRALIKKVPARKDAVAINDAILEVMALARTEVANNSVSVRTQFAEGLPRVQGDRVRLQQVMLNLIVNAIQSMSGVEDGNRELHISTVSIEPEGVCVAVRDTGHGLRPENLPRLFEPFYTTKPDGMGMGLSICRSIIEAHGGRLWATSCEPRGALFQFTIPSN